MGQNNTKVHQISLDEELPSYSEKYNLDVNTVKPLITNSENIMDMRTFINEIKNIFCNDTENINNVIKFCQNRIYWLNDEVIKKQKSYYDHLVYNTELCNDFGIHDQAIWDQIVGKLITCVDSKGETYYYPWSNLSRADIVNPFKQKHIEYLESIDKNEKSEINDMMYYFKKNIPIYIKWDKCVAINDISKQVKAICKTSNPIKEFNNLVITIGLINCKDYPLSNEIDSLINYYNSKSETIKVHPKYNVINEFDWYSELEMSFVLTCGKVILNENNILRSPIEKFFGFTVQ